MLLIVDVLQDLYETEAFKSVSDHELLIIHETDIRKMNVLQFPLTRMKEFTEWAEQRDRLMFPYYPKKVDELITSLTSGEMFDRLVESPDVLNFGKIFSQYVGVRVKERYVALLPDVRCY